MRSLGQDDNQMQVLSMMQSKLPRSVLVKLEEMKPEGEEWTVEKFRRLLKRHISAQEAGDLQAKLFQKTDESLRSPISNKLYSYDTNTKHSTGESLLSNVHQKPRFGRNYIFCNDEQHWSDECSTYPDIQSRRKQLKNRYLKCMKQDHMVKDCRLTGKVWVHCGEKDKHHCTKKFKNKEEITTNNAIVTNNVLSKEAIPNKETTMLAAGKHVVMQTALVEATSTDQMLSEVTRVLIDTGSSRTYVTKEIVNKLKLNPQVQQINNLHFWN